MHFYGIITPEFDSKAHPKVQLSPLAFTGAREINWNETYTEFNYMETKSYIFLFWPKIFDGRK